MPTQPAPHYDLVIVGGGIVGLAVAREALLRRPDLHLAVLEKEPQVAGHQSSHNSGVIHAGIYYPVGSFKARAAVEGREKMIAYCQEKGLPFERCGKVIVALTQEELPRLDALYERGVANGVQGLEVIGPERLHELELHVAGIKAIYSPNTGIADFAAVARSYAAEIEAAGGEIFTGCPVTRIAERPDGIVLHAVRQGQPVDFEAAYAITCGGLHSDHISRMSGGRSELQIVPFRGDYYLFRPEKAAMVRSLIYPVPDPALPFLGVHFTRTTSGQVWAGPNAILALAREGYRRVDFNLKDIAEMLAWPGFWSMAAHFWKVGIDEMLRDTFKGVYVRQLQRYMPSLKSADLVDGPSGVRAQTVTRSGALSDDFIIDHKPHITHVLNAPSPAATSSLVLSRLVIDQVAGHYERLAAH